MSNGMSTCAQCVRGNQSNQNGFSHTQSRFHGFLSRMLRKRCLIPFVYLFWVFPVAAPALAATCAWQGPFDNTSYSETTSSTGAAITQAEFDSLTPVADVTTDCGAYLETVTTIDPARK